jgi:hypothetical protein
MMNQSDFEILTAPNVKFVLDSQGNGWYCDAAVNENSDLHGQGCVSEEDWHYDRMFGG